MLSSPLYCDSKWFEIRRPLMNIKLMHLVHIPCVSDLGFLQQHQRPCFIALQHILCYHFKEFLTFLYPDTPGDSGDSGPL